MSESFTPPTTKIEIQSQAAILAGRQDYNTLDGGGPFALSADKLLDTLITGELGSNRWRFAQTSMQISAFTTLTPTWGGWLYYFPIPSDCLMFTSVYPFVDYLVYGDKVLTTSNNSLTAKYTRSVPVSKWPPAFSMYIVYELASLLAVSVTNSDRMVARIEANRAKWESRALFADGQNSRAARMRSNPWVDVRFQFRNRRR